MTGKDLVPRGTKAIDRFGGWGEAFYRVNEAGKYRLSIKKSFKTGEYVAKAVVVGDKDAQFNGFGVTPTDAMANCIVKGSDLLAHIEALTGSRRGFRAGDEVLFEMETFDPEASDYLAGRKVYKISVIQGTIVDLEPDNDVYKVRYLDPPSQVFVEDWLPLVRLSAQGAL
jgi:hypothetical protein